MIRAIFCNRLDLVFLNEVEKMSDPGFSMAVPGPGARDISGSPSLYEQSRLFHEVRSLPNMFRVQKRG